jgi:hypothetical protein
MAKEGIAPTDTLVMAREINVHIKKCVYMTKNQRWYVLSKSYIKKMLGESMAYDENAGLQSFQTPLLRTQVFKVEGALLQRIRSSKNIPPSIPVDAAGSAEVDTHSEQQEHPSVNPVDAAGSAEVDA